MADFDVAYYEQKKEENIKKAKGRLIAGCIIIIISIFFYSRGSHYMDLGGLGNVLIATFAYVCFFFSFCGGVSLAGYSYRKLKAAQASTPQSLYQKDVRKQEIKQKIYDVISGREFHDSQFYQEHAEELNNATCSFVGKELTRFESAMNLGVSDYLKTFTYKDRILTVTLRKGKSITGRLEDMTASFTVYKGDNVNCKLECGGQSLDIFSVWHALTDEEWYEVFNLLTWCGTTYNAGGYAAMYQRQHSKVYKGIKYANTALKIINHLS